MEKKYCKSCKFLGTQYCFNEVNPVPKSPGAFACEDHEERTEEGCRALFLEMLEELGGLVAEASLLAKAIDDYKVRMDLEREGQ